MQAHEVKANNFEKFNSNEKNLDKESFEIKNDEKIKTLKSTDAIKNNINETSKLFKKSTSQENNICEITAHIKQLNTYNKINNMIEEDIVLDFNTCIKKNNLINDRFDIDDKLKWIHNLARIAKDIEQFSASSHFIFYFIF
ncbi:hypothetical protein NAPIS_ORF00622 [Vairimorpha apis BRL 01]|uniref:Uncharacterized protein n=1 Tax=Vairimorpha apis BRL 01 TaxID=1037528 RepID=T0LBY7_9MICR|nr:hypothetical protein NAPIS_ORF00622 [Vairimorpha apis BRL 01]